MRPGFYCERSASIMSTRLDWKYSVCPIGIGNFESHGHPALGGNNAAKDDNQMFYN